MKLEPTISQEHLAELGKALQTELPTESELPAEMRRALSQLDRLPEKTYLRIPVWLVAVFGLTGLLAVATIGFAIAVVSN